jgi:hypothetical protein
MGDLKLNFLFDLSRHVRCELGIAGCNHLIFPLSVEQIRFAQRRGPYVTLVIPSEVEESLDVCPE